MPATKISSTSIEMLRESVEKKADEKWVEAMMDPLKEDLTEIKQIALSARKKADEPAIGKNIKLTGVISAVVFIVGIAGQFFALKNSVENNQASISGVQEDIAEVKVEVQEIKTIVEADKSEKKTEDLKQLEAMKAAIKEAMQETPSSISRR